MDTTAQPPREEPSSAVIAAIRAHLQLAGLAPAAPLVVGYKVPCHIRGDPSHEPQGWCELDANGHVRYGRRDEREVRSWQWQPPAPEPPADAAEAAPTPPPAEDKPVTAAPEPAAEVRAPEAAPPAAGDKPADAFLDQIVNSPFATHRTPEPAAEKPTEATSAPAEKPAEATAPAEEEEEEERATTFPAKFTAALRYAECGFPVLPLHSITENGGCTCGKTDCSSPGKHPRTLHGLKDASIDPDIIRRWWTQWPDANIGIVTGAVSGLLVVDIDGAEGERSRDALIATHGPLPETLPARTGHGWHLYFKLPANCGSIRGSAGKLGKGIDTRADDGYVVAPPSVHASGIEYEFIGGFDPQRIALAPDWLLALLMNPCAAEPAKQEGSGPQEKQEGGEQEQKEGGEQPAQQKPLVSLNKLRISERLRGLIRDGKPRGERSQAIWAVILGSWKLATARGCSSPCCSIRPTA
jgi:Bifunctional DNA primase/polymerase, N-terminal